ncbi:hypothetical protein JJJ17_14120 [Paracoccus caeni]|uniref:Uncharacterized protein n=1 Tax=Paracoccus caeni TaxID=657651 RepID=A0A934W0L4_9RHOB|nr:hypothetical protein [Paracoccus caeni]MBK4217065.1 hypothetical protein [Paracoccus caeni]
MIGVIVWSSEDREKAVIWCEDHASLAYLQGRSSLTDPQTWPGPGDLVELESEIVGALRYARHVAMVSENGRPDLGEMLKAQPVASRESHLRLVASSDVEPTDRIARAPAWRVGAAR